MLKRLNRPETLLLMLFGFTFAMARENEDPGARSQAQVADSADATRNPSTTADSASPPPSQSGTPVNSTRDSVSVERRDKSLPDSHGSNKPRAEGVAGPTHGEPIKVEGLAEAYRGDDGISPTIETRRMGTTVIRGQAKIAAAKRSAYNVNAIDVTKLKEKNITVNEILGRSIGVVAREEGGMGSGSSVSLNGMSGNQVKVFLDGLPMENRGSSMGMDNFPANNIETIEVYKGVVPIHLGSDALGGAIDIKTGTRATNYLDASYALSSFNTHRANLGGQWFPGYRGLFLKASGSYNTSNNDYFVNVRPADWNNGSYGPERRLRRFHDGYHAYFLNAEAGVSETAYADLASLSLSHSEDHDDIQHAVSMDRVFGKVFSETEATLLTAKYRKNALWLDGLSAKAYASVAWTGYDAVDTANRQYDWLGNFRPQNNAFKGEATWQKTLYRSEAREISSNVNLTYAFLEVNQVSVNYALNHVRRLGRDLLDEFEYVHDKPSTALDQVYAASYKREFFEGRGAATAFAKLYRMSPTYRAYDYDDGKEIVSGTDRRHLGYGMATTAFAGKSWQFKASYENAVRMPESREIFGDAILQEGNDGLKPERSQNVNAGAIFGKSFSRLKVNAEANLFHRRVTDLIRQDNQGLVTKYVNQSQVRITGIEGEAGMGWDHRLEATVNATYQDLINATRSQDGRPSAVYLDRLPNIPYLYGNASVTARWPRPFGAPLRLSASAHTRYVHTYFLNWPSQGDPGTKHSIPRQTIHSLGITFSSPGDDLSLALECGNATDEEAFDNFRMQKPGRSYSAKIRYSR